MLSKEGLLVIVLSEAISGHSGTSGIMASGDYSSLGSFFSSASISPSSSLENYLLLSSSCFSGDLSLFSAAEDFFFFVLEDGLLLPLDGSFSSTFSAFLKRDDRRSSLSLTYWSVLAFSFFSFINLYCSSKKEESPDFS